MNFKKIAFTDVDGVLRGKYVSTAKFEKKQLGFCDVVFGWDINDKVYEKDSVTGWYSGFPDGKLTIDLESERQIPWESKTKMYLADFYEDEKLKNVCPRSLLKEIITKYHALGVYPKVGFEYEWFNFKKQDNVYENAVENTLTKGMFGYSLVRLQQSNEFVHELLSYLQGFDIAIEGFHTETGPGVFEAALQYTNALKAADDAVLFKHTVKEIGLKHQITPNFMAKWNEDLPGCGCHIHLSLHDSSGKNITELKSIQNSNSISEYFLEGILHGMVPLQAIYNPTINSYKRLIEGSWAATSVSWGYQNRTTAVRLITDEEKTQHIEMRLPGADVNPYLALYALLASGLYGIQQKKNLQLNEQTGNAYSASENKLLAKSLEQAITVMENSNELPKMLNEQFLKHYILTRKWEVSQFQKTVTNWELQRYFEIV